jgi:hypothetical protein
VIPGLFRGVCATADSRRVGRADGCCFAGVAYTYNVCAHCSSGRSFLGWSALAVCLLLLRHVRRRSYVEVWMRLLQRLVTLSLCLLTLSCATPRSVRDLEDVKAVGDFFYEEHRRHECGSDINGFMCVHRCASFFWKYWRASGNFGENVNVLQSNLVDLGLDFVPTDYGRRLWSWNYEAPNGGVHVQVTAGTQTWTQKKVVEQATRDEALTGEYVYGIQASYQTTWDLMVQNWRNYTFVFRSCSGDDRPGFVLQPK